MGGGGKELRKGVKVRNVIERKGNESEQRFTALPQGVTVLPRWETVDSQLLCQRRGFPGGSDSKEYTSNVRDWGSIPGSGRSPGEGHGNPLQYSCLENPKDREAWWARVHRVTKSWTRLSD